MRISEFLSLDREEQFKVLAAQNDENFLIFLCEKYPHIIYDYVKQYLAFKLNDDVVIITGPTDMEYYVDSAFASLLLKDPVIGLLMCYSELFTPTDMEGKEVDKKYYDMGASRNLRPKSSWKDDTKGKTGIKFVDEFPQDAFELLFTDCKALNYLEVW